MSIETMLNELLPDPEEFAARAKASIEAANASNQRYVAQLQELYAQLTTETDEDTIERLEDEASDLAEFAEITFIYQRADGTERTYSPEAHWEASGGCEWVESAQYGSDYGWNI
jgi:hypothetical protein